MSANDARKQSQSGGPVPHRHQAKPGWLLPLTRSCSHSESL